MNYNYFDSIDTEEKAYWLGFIFADGNISKSERMYKGKLKRGNYRFELSLKAEDKSHLEKFAKAIGFNKEVKISKAVNRANRCRLYFNNKHLWTILNSYGCTPNKSLTLTFPKLEIFLNKELIKHFIRGYIDGDGSICYRNAVHTDFQLRILGTENFLTILQQQLPLEKQNKLHKDINIFELCFSGSRGLYVCNYLYKNSNIHLDRKYSRYIEYSRLYQE